MTPTQLVRMLNHQYVSLMDNYDKFYYQWWYEYVYTLVVRQLKETFTELDEVRFSWCVATGEEWDK